MLLLGAILDTPGLADRLLEALRPELIVSGGAGAVGRDRRENHRDPLVRSTPAEGRRTR